MATSDRLTRSLLFRRPRAGQVGQGLNFDEIVVYKNEAALPTHLIVYALH